MFIYKNYKKLLNYISRYEAIAVHIIWFSKYS